MLGDDHLAEDAVQETFLALTRHLDKIEVVESSKTRKFLMTIVKSKAIDILRKQKGDLSVEELEYDIPAGQPDALSQYITRENYNAIVACVLELEENYRVIFEYKYVHGLSDREIGDLLGISSKTVNVRYFRAQEKASEHADKGGGRQCGTIRNGKNWKRNCLRRPPTNVWRSS